jgi:hypothetical protein
VESVEAIGYMRTEKANSSIHNQITRRDNRGFAMAYPVPIPTFRGKDAEEFQRKLIHFRLTESQKAIYRRAAELFGPGKTD